MCEMVDPSTSRSARLTCVAAIKTKNYRETARDVMRAKYKGTIQVKNCKGKEDLVKTVPNFIVNWVWQKYPRRYRRIPTTTLYPISVEWEDSSIWGISTQIKCGGSNVLAVAASELTNIIGTKTILHICLGQYMSQVELGKYWITCHPNLVLKFEHLNDLEDVGLFNISGLEGLK